MPLLINEVIVDVEPAAPPPHESQPPQDRAPVSDAEYQLIRVLALLEERRARLRID